MTSSITSLGTRSSGFSELIRLPSDLSEVKEEEEERPGYAVVVDVGQVDSLFILSHLSDAAILDRASAVCVDSDEAEESIVVLRRLADPRLHMVLKSIVGVNGGLQLLLICLVFFGLLHSEAQSYNLSVYRANWLDFLSMWLLTGVVAIEAFRNVVRNKNVGGKWTLLRTGLKALAVDTWDNSEDCMLLAEFAVYFFVAFPTLVIMTLLIATSIKNTLVSTFMFIVTWGVVRSVCDPYDLGFHLLVVVVSISIMSQTETILGMFFDFLAMEFLLRLDTFTLEALQNGIFGGTARGIFQQLEGPVVLHMEARLKNRIVLLVFILTVFIFCQLLLSGSPPAYLDRATWVASSDQQCLQCLPSKHALFRTRLSNNLVDPLGRGRCQLMTGVPMPETIGGWQLYHELTDTQLMVYMSPNSGADETLSPYSVPCESLPHRRVLLEVPRSPLYGATHVNFERTWNFSSEGILDFEEDYPPDCDGGVDFEVKMSAPVMNNHVYRFTDCWTEVPAVQNVLIHVSGSLQVAGTEETLATGEWVTLLMIFGVLLFSWFIIPCIRAHHYYAKARPRASDDYEGSSGEPHPFDFIFGADGYSGEGHPRTPRMY